LEQQQNPFYKLHDKAINQHKNKFQISTKAIFTKSSLHALSVLQANGQNQTAFTL
jgi:hypothetical protein